MQIRCSFCRTMFAINHDEMLSALEQIEEQKLKFYDAHCPKCRRANRVERLKLEFSYPDWRADLKKLAGQKPAAATAAPALKQEPAPGALKKKHSHKPAGQEPVAPPVKKVSTTAAPAKAKKAVIAGKGGTANAAVKTAKKPVAKTAVKTAKKPAAKTAVKTAKKPASKTPAKTAKKPVAKTVKKPAGSPKGGAKKK